MKSSVAVCIASYCGEKYIAEQLDSIIFQLDAGDRIYLADDGSIDLTLEIVSKYSDRITVVATDKVGSIVKNFERALSASDADIFVLCDQDDKWLPGRLNAIKKELVGCDLLMLNGDVVNESLEYSGRDIFSVVGVRSGFWRNLLKNSFVGCCMAFNRDVRDKVIPFPRGVVWHDWYIGLMAELYFKIRRNNESYLLYRRHGGNFSSTSEKSKNSIAKKIIIRIKMMMAIMTASLR